jgi:hypothetical protein
MSDRSIAKEIEANNRRKEIENENEDGDPAIDDALEEALDPITEAIRRIDADRHTVENDAQQR